MAEVSGSVPDLYAILKISRDAVPKVIDRAFKEAIYETHPDRRPDVGTAELQRLTNTTAELNHYREIFKDPVQRAAYDEKLKAQARRQRYEQLQQTPSRAEANPFWSPAAEILAQDRPTLQRRGAYRTAHREQADHKNYSFHIETHEPPSIQRRNAGRRRVARPPALEEEAQRSPVKAGQAPQYSFMPGDDAPLMQGRTPSRR